MSEEAREPFDVDLEARFDDPPRDFSPTPLWWWSGEKVTRERLEWQMRRFAEGGVYNLVLINLAPAGPQFGAETDDPQWFSDEWWQRVDDACDIAEELGMRLWFYDQLGFSGANIQGRIARDNPWVAGQSLSQRTARVVDGRIALDSHERVVAAFTPDRAQISISPEGALTMAEPQEEVIVLTTTPSAFDYLNPRAVELLMDAVHGEFDRRLPHRLGGVIAGSFQDELAGTNSWTSDFLEQFATRKGYDLLPHLLSLFGPGTPTDAKIRSDYYEVRAALTESALFAPLSQWHLERGMLVGADQSNPARAGLPIQSTQIYTDYPRTHRHISALGSDHEGDSKFPASLAKLYGHDRVWIEAFHSAGWGATLEETWDWLVHFVRRGATLYNPHASYFSTVAGWFEWAPPSTDWRQPYWSQYRQFADAVSRITSCMTWGSASADVAVLHPTATMQAAIPLDIPIDHWYQEDFETAATDVLRTQRVYLDLVGKDDWFHFKPSLLDEAGVLFDIVDDASLSRSQSADGRLKVGDAGWRTIVIPSAPFLEAETARRLLLHLDNGGRVIVVGEEPEYATSRDGDDSAIRALVGHPRLERVDRPADVIVALAGAGTRQYALADTPILVRRSGSQAVALLGGAYPNATSQPLRPTLGLGKVEDYDFARKRYLSHQTITVSASLARAEVWDPTTGRRRPAEVSVHPDGTSRILVETGGAPASLVVWAEGDGRGATPPIPPATSATVLGPWRGELVSTMDNTWGDFARPVGGDVADLQLWSFDTATSDSRWTGTWATLGQRARLRSARAEDAPRWLEERDCLELVRVRAHLDDTEWTRVEWSSSRGRRRDGAPLLGLKGRVPTHFIPIPPFSDDQCTIIRSFVITDARGPADLVVLGAGAAVEARWNGRPLNLEGFETSVGSVQLDREINVLEYRLQSLAGAPASGDGSAFSLFPPGGFPRPPEWIAVSDRGFDETRRDIVYSVALPRVAAVETATLSVGSALSLTIRIDGVVVARQQEVDYYSASSEPAPYFFVHDVTEFLRSTPAALEIELHDATATDAIWVDLAITDLDGNISSVVSDATWTGRRDGERAAATLQRRSFSDSTAAHAVRRPHLLPEADWLRGGPELGLPSLRFRVTDDLKPRPQSYRVLLPAGACAVTVPSPHIDAAWVDGQVAAIHDGRLIFDPPLPQTAVLDLQSRPLVGVHAGAVFSGPLVVTHEASPIELGDWREIGLRSWSGGIAYETVVSVPSDDGWTLDLGDLRGSVEVTLDGMSIGSAFCAPFRFEMPAGRGQRTLRVTVYNTLGPFLSESTATSWVLPSQEVSGLFGPVVARFS
ncbi:hypothetical protein ACIQLJ_01750 [Microbacterium sp. NPDC091313]